MEQASKNITETSSLPRFKFHIRCKDFTELINGSNCSTCVICTSKGVRVRVIRIVFNYLSIFCKCKYSLVI